MPLVSVIIPTFNRRSLVREAIASVLVQAGVPLEVVVVDDGSTDGTAAAIGAEFGDRVSIVSQPRRGVAAARNAGASLARGKWIALLDSDDLWLPGKLEAQAAFHAAHPDLLISQTDEIWIRNGVRVNPRRLHEKPSGDIFAPSLERCLVSPSAVMMRRELFAAVGGFDESLTVCEDYDLWLRLAARLDFGLLPHRLVVKRGGHPDQLSRRFWGMDRFRVASLCKLLAHPQVTGGRRRAVIEALERKCAILAAGARRRGRCDEAARYVRLAEAARAACPGMQPLTGVGRPTT